VRGLPTKLGELTVALKGQGHGEEVVEGEGKEGRASKSASGCEGTRVSGTNTRTPRVATCSPLR
jgi:hypothetical protein